MNRGPVRCVIGDYYNWSHNLFMELTKEESCFTNLQRIHCKEAYTMQRIHHNNNLKIRTPPLSCKRTHMRKIQPAKKLQTQVCKVQRATLCRWHWRLVIMWSVVISIVTLTLAIPYSLYRVVSFVSYRVLTDLVRVKRLVLHFHLCR